MTGEVEVHDVDSRITPVDKERIQEKRSSLRDLAYVLFRRKWVIVGVLMSTVVPVALYSLWIPPLYEAKSRLLVKPGREHIYVASVGSPEGMHPPTIVQRVAEVIRSEIEIFKSRVLVRRVVEELGVARLFSNSRPENPTVAHAENNESLSVEAAVSRALRNISIQRVKGTDVIEVGYRSHDPDISASFVTTLVDRFLERHVEVHQSGQSYDFFKVQSNQLNQVLRTAARRLADFKKKNSIVSFEQLKTLTLNQYSGFNTARDQNKTAIKETRARINKLKEDLIKTSEHRYLSQAENTDPPVISTLKTRLAELELQKADLMHKYKADNYQVVNVIEAIAMVKEMLANEEDKFHGSVNTGFPQAYQTLEAELLSHEANLEALRERGVEIEKRVIEYGKELERLGRLEPELQALQRAVNIHEQNYRLYLTKFEESRVSDAMDAAKVTSVSILEPATVPLRPIPVNKALNIFVSLCVGGVAGLGLAFLLHYFDHSFRFPEDIQNNLGVPMLCSIDDLPTTQRENLETLAARSQPPLHYQILKSRILMFAGEKGMKTLSVCSLTPQEGASTVALNLAVWLAKNNGSRLVLVDANLRNPSVHSSCRLPASPGFSEVIHEGVNIRDAIKQSVIPNLSVLTSGVSPPNPMVVFESPQLADLVETLRSEFDWVIFDCAPADVYPEAALLARRIDGTMLVIQAENRGAEVAIRAKEQLEQAGAKIVGAVLNRWRQIIPEKIYKTLS